MQTPNKIGCVVVVDERTMNMTSNIVVMPYKLCLMSYIYIYKMAKESSYVWKSYQTRKIFFSQRLHLSEFAHSVDKVKIRAKAKIIAANELA